MRRPHVLVLGLLLMMAAACGDGEGVERLSPRCDDGRRNGDEAAVDCGGSCDACEAEPTCRDGVQNGDEAGIDCGGACRACEAVAGCTDGTQNGGEEGVDCGGNCASCAPGATCDDGVENGAEEEVDCGGDCAACEAAASCLDGIQNAAEEGVDCGGACARCREAAPEAWRCAEAWYDDQQCDCGCGAVDEDCASAGADACVADACATSQRVDPEDNARCIAYPPTPSNPSFEETPTQSAEIPGWTIVGQEGISDAMVVGPTQTTAPDGDRALFLSSTYRHDAGMYGYPSPIELESAPFLPVGGQCELTLSVGDANVVEANSDYGTVRVRADGVLGPLGVLAELDIDTRGAADSVAPTADTYQDVVLSFTHDGARPLTINIVANARPGALSFHVDGIRLNCP